MRYLSWLLVVAAHGLFLAHSADAQGSGEFSITYEDVVRPKEINDRSREMINLQGDIKDNYPFLKNIITTPRFKMPFYTGALPVRTTVVHFQNRNTIRFNVMRDTIELRRSFDPRAQTVGRWIDNELQEWGGNYRRWQQKAEFEARALQSTLDRMEAARGCDGILFSGKTVDHCGICGGINQCLYY